MPSPHAARLPSTELPSGNGDRAESCHRQMLGSAFALVVPPRGQARRTILCAIAATHYRHERIAAGTPILGGGDRGVPLDYKDFSLDAGRVRALYGSTHGKRWSWRNG